MKPEARMRRRLLRELRALGFQAQAVETPETGAGLPDVEACAPAGPWDQPAGWLELKQLKAWPRRATTPLRLPHLTLRQARWLHRRALASGRCGLVLKVGPGHWFVASPQGVTRAWRHQHGHERRLFGADGVALPRAWFDDLPVARDGPFDAVYPVHGLPVVDPPEDARGRRTRDLSTDLGHAWAWLGEACRAYRAWYERYHEGDLSREDGDGRA